MKGTTLTEIPRPTWKEEYILPYESVWGVRGKYCTLNAYSFRSFTKKKTGYTKKIYPLGNLMGEIQYASRYDSSLINKKIRICRECIKYGYHSDYHQVTLFRHCFIHKNEELLEIEAIYTDADECRNKYQFPVDLTEHIPDLIKNASVKQSIANFEKRTDGKLQGLLFIDLNGGPRNRQFGKNRPCDSLIELFESFTINQNSFQREIHNVNKIRDIDFSERISKQEISDIRDIRGNIDILLSNAISNGMGISSNEWNNLIVLPEAFKQNYYRVPGKEREAIWNHKTSLITGIVDDVREYHFRKMNEKYLFKEVSGVPQYLICDTEGRCIVYACRS